MHNVIKIDFCTNTNLYKNLEKIKNKTKNIINQVFEFLISYRKSQINGP